MSQTLTTEHGLENIRSQRMYMLTLHINAKGQGQKYLYAHTDGQTEYDLSATIDPLMC